MTEKEARTWAETRFSADVIDRLDCFAAIVVEQSALQNLVAPSTLESLWNRHIVDSLQLLPLAGEVRGPWIDIGTGAGFPGLAIAVACPECEMVLVEPRRLRADYLRSAAIRLGLGRVEVIQDKIERVSRKAAVISARAVAPIERLLASARQCADSGTTWLLPKGKTAPEEVAQARRRWHGMFHVEQSLTDPESRIVIASGVRPR